MNIDVDLLLRSLNARNQIVTWLLNRPNVGLNVTDVALLVDGYDYLGKVITELTGRDIKDIAVHITDETHNIQIEGNHETT